MAIFLLACVCKFSVFFFSEHSLLPVLSSGCFYDQINTEK